MKPIIIESSINGIPCQIKVTSYNRVKGSMSYNAPSDMDYYGYTEMEWEILDRKGYPASWLEKKISDRENDRIEQAIIDYMED
jgi:hypothetical protein